MKNWHIAAVICSPLLGLVLAVLVVVFVDADALNPQRLGPAGMAGLFSLMFFLFGWVITVPLGVILLVIKRRLDPDGNNEP